MMESTTLVLSQNTVDLIKSLKGGLETLSQLQFEIGESVNENVTIVKLLISTIESLGYKTFSILRNLKFDYTTTGQGLVYERQYEFVTLYLPANFKESFENSPMNSLLEILVLLEEVELVQKHTDQGNKPICSSILKAFQTEAQINARARFMNYYNRI